MKLKHFFVIAFLLVIAGTIASCQSDEQLEFNRYYSSGRVVYQSHCQNCHGANGEGLQGLIPPLTDQAYLKANKNVLACSVNNGLKGKITIQGREFDGTMPSNDLAPINLAMALTYVTNSFGNKLGVITSGQVEKDLSACK
jgi:mono/diheme cytochrome c family protein